MKKLFLILLLLSTVFTLAACGTNKKDVLRVGMDLRWPPFETVDLDAEATGISVDLAYELGKYLDMEIEIVDLEFGSLITALETNEIDIIIGSMSITTERAVKINFSDPYFFFPLITVLNKDFSDANTITSKEDLFLIDGVKFVGPKSFVSLSIPEAEALNPILNEVNDSNAAVLEIVAGTSDAFIISASSAAGYHAANPDTTVILWDAITSSPIGMGMRKTDTQLLEDVNMFISMLDDEGGVYERLAVLYNDVIAEGLPGQGLDFYTGE